MNQNLKNVIIFVSGAALGSLCTWLSVKSYYETKADEEVRSVKEAYEDHLESLEADSNKSSLDGDIEGPKELEGDGKKSVSSIAREMNNKPPLKDYTKYFKEKGEESLDLKEIKRSEDLQDMASEPGPGLEDDALTDEEDEEEQLEYEGHKLNGDHQKALEEHKLPYIIDKSDYELTCSHYEKASLLYYIAEDILCEDSGEEVSRFDVVGTCIADSKFDDNDDESLYVRNDRLMCDYDITKVYTPYER